MKTALNTSPKRVKLLVIILWVSAMFLAVISRANAGSTGNAVATFFENSERQLEAKSQCYVLKLALIDMITKSPEQLKLRRYQNAEGKAAQWSITELLGKHFLSSARMDKASFYEDYRKKPAKTAIAKQIQALGGCASYAGAAPNETAEIGFEKLIENPKDLGISQSVKGGR